jgi:8-oxo-dGTP pyrophosphatase MutT (NUDIX family)
MSSEEKDSHAANTPHSLNGYSFFSIGMYNNSTKIKIKCTNCGNFGHAFRQCLAPVTSYGMIIFRILGEWDQAKNLLTHENSVTGLELEQSKIEYLLIQRKDSLGFVEILRSKYKLSDTEYIRKQLSGTTATERNKLRTQTFDELWVGLWGISSEKSGQAYKNEKETSRTKFELLRSGYTLDTGEFVSLETILDSITAIWDTPEWGFPKGRLDSFENEFSCAVREVREETGLTTQDIVPIRNLQPIQESFFGSNHVHYCHKYFIAYMPNVKDITVDLSNNHMVREIGNIRWFSLDDALRIIRPDNVEKKEILLKASSLLRNYCPLRFSSPKVDGAVS